MRVTRGPATSAVKDAGAGGPCDFVGDTVALACAVAPPAPVTTIVNVVVAVTVTVCEPLAPTAAPLIDADVALVVCQLTSAVLADCSAA